MHKFVNVASFKTERCFGVSILRIFCETKVCLIYVYLEPHNLRTKQKIIIIRVQAILDFLVLNVTSFEHCDYTYASFL